MASMVAKACGTTSSQMPSMIVQERGSRNKRKFRADPPLADSSKSTPLPSNGCTSFEFSAEKFETHGHTMCCNFCSVNQDTSNYLKLDLGLSCPVGPSESSCPREEAGTSADEFRDADWSDLTETELEQLVLSNLDAIFKSAIKKIIDNGYSEDVATKAILRSGLWYGCKDTVSNVVDNTLSFLRSGQEIDRSREHYFEDLKQMGKYILAELVCLLREVRPFFSTGDAMWCLLICDMNVSQACAMDSDPLGGFLGEGPSNPKSCISGRSQSITEMKNIEPNEAHKVNNTSDSKPKASFAPNGLLPDNECRIPTAGANGKLFSATGASQTEEKFVGSRKVSGITKREYILRHKSTHFEKHYRTYGSKGASRAGKLGSVFSGLVLDKKLKGVADSTGVNAKNAPFKSDKTSGFDSPLENAIHDLSMPAFGLEIPNHGSSLPKSNKISPTSPLMPAADALSSLPGADTELSLSLPARGTVNPVPISYSVEATDCSFFGSWSDGSLPQDKKDEVIMKLVPRVRELQSQLQEWTEWANQKVMQAARRLSKDKAELKTLRQEKEEVERLRKEKQMLEEGTVKKLSEMENALRKASGQVERANGAVRRLEVENVTLRREMESAKLRAAESAASCQEVSRREKKTLTKFRSWEKQKIVFQEELSAEKSKLGRIQQKLQHAKDVCHQVEAKLNEEEKAKDEQLTQASLLKKEREQIEVSTQSKEEMIKSRAQTDLQKYKDDIGRLEKEISQMRLKTDSSKIAALRRGIDGIYDSKLTDLKKNPSHKDSAITYVSKMMTTTNLKNFAGVKRERECVMCLSEEMSVVFLPCAHQVVCTTCNELHKKQGMKDCPSCRSLIQRRVSVRYARP
ncbi:hypothetical protein OROHE_017930 [Orobanche hederae]